MTDGGDDDVDDDNELYIIVLDLEILKSLTVGTEKIKY